MPGEAAGGISRAIGYAFWTMAFRTALVVFAHPDDAEFGFGGTVARWARERMEVHYLCITDGSAGSNETRSPSRRCWATPFSRVSTAPTL